MRGSFSRAVLWLLTGALGVGGCATTGEMKEQGVYTTIAVEGHHLDMPDSNYATCKTFAPGQTPLAVVVGYGYWDGSFNHPQAFDLQVVEMSTGSIILNRSGNALAGRAALLPLPIRKTGNYQVKLIINNSVYDTWDFTVNREANAPDGSTPVKYAQGVFGVAVGPTPAIDAVMQYDSSLMGAALRAVQKEAEKSDRSIFAQMAPGQVVIQCSLDDRGMVIEPKLIGNTLNEALGQFFLHALQNGAPYPAWPDAVRAFLGSGPRLVQFTFHYD